MIRSFFLLFSIGLFSASAVADHSIQTIIDGNSSGRFFQIVTKLVKARGVTCDYQRSIQMTVPDSGSDVWRQVAFCFKDESSMVLGNKWLTDRKMDQYFCQELDPSKAKDVLNEQVKTNCFAGAYGMNVSALLDITYRFTGVTEQSRSGKSSREIIEILKLTIN